MENMPTMVHSSPPPPPPPPQRSRKWLWIGLAAGAVVICLCCVLAVVIFNFRTDIPLISSFFPTATPASLYYTNPASGISLYYPASWVYEDTGDASSGYTAIFASSQAILDDINNVPSTGAAMAVITGLTSPDFGIPSSVDSSSASAVLDYLASQAFSDMTVLEGIRELTISGYPAAAGIYSVTNDDLSQSTLYLVAILRNEEIIMAYGVSPQSEWPQYRPLMDLMLNSFSLSVP